MKKKIATITACVLLSLCSLAGQIDVPMAVTITGYGSESSTNFQTVFDRTVPFSLFTPSMNVILEIKRGKDAAWSEAITLSGIENDVLAVVGGIETSPNVVALHSGSGFSPGTGGLAYKMIFTGLKKSIAYYIRLYATLNGQNSQYSNEQAIQFDNTADTNRPTITTLPVVSSITTTSAIVTWGVGETGLTNTVEYWTGSGAHVTVAATSTTTPSVSLTGLTVAGVYNYIVRSLDLSGNYSQASSNFTTTASATPGSFVWGSVGVPGFAGVTYPKRVAVDSSSNIFSCGVVEGPVTFGNISVGGVGQQADGYVMKHDANGNPLWGRTIGNSEIDQLFGLAVTPAGDVIVCGAFGFTVDFGGQSKTSAMRIDYPTFSADDIYVAKYSGTDGSLVWVQQFGSTGFDTGRGLTIDSSGNIIMVADYTSPSIAFGSTTLVSTSGGQIIAVVKMSSLGVPLWAAQLGDSGNSSPNSIALNSSGDIYICGNVSGSVNYGGGVKVSSTGGDLFLTKRSGANGSWLWDKVIGGTSSERATDVAVDQTSGNVIINAIFGAGCNFGGPIRQFNDLSTNNVGGICVVAYSSVGSFLWGRTPYDTQTGYSLEESGGLCIDSSGNIFYNGRATNRTAYGPYPEYPWLFGYNAMFVHSITSSGGPRWAIRSAGTSGGGLSVAIGTSGSIIVFGKVINGTMQINQLLGAAGGTVATTSAKTAPFLVKLVK